MVPACQWFSLLQVSAPLLHQDCLGTTETRKIQTPRSANLGCRTSFRLRGGVKFDEDGARSPARHWSPPHAKLLCSAGTIRRPNDPRLHAAIMSEQSFCNLPLLVSKD